LFLPDTDYVLPGTDTVQGLIILRGSLPTGGNKLVLKLKNCSAVEAKQMKRTLQYLTDSKSEFVESVRKMGNRKPVVTVECMKVALNATTENGSTVVFGKVVGVKPQEVRATISFPADDVSLKDAF
jgi:hypothetical protein